MNVQDLIQVNIPTFSPTDDANTTARVVQALGYKHAIIANEGTFLGYASVESLLKNKLCEQAIEYALNAFVFSPNNHLYEAVPLFYKSNLSHIAIIDKNAKLLGIAEQQKINEKLLQTLTYRGNGAILVLKINSRDFVLSRLAALVEENNAKIVGMMIEEMPPYLYVNLKLNTIEVDAILAGFARFSINVEQCYGLSSMQDNQNKEFDIALRHFDF